MHGGQIQCGGGVVIIESDQRHVLWHAPSHAPQLLQQGSGHGVDGDADGGRLLWSAEQLRDDAGIDVLLAASIDMG